MRILLDTHTWLWFYLGDSRLSLTARTLIEDSDNEKLISPASYWELAIKFSMGKLQLHESFEDLLQHAIVDNGFAVLPIDSRHAVCVSQLPFLPDHKDPFDRLLIAQAITETIPVVSIDGAFDLYGVKRLWA